LNEILTEIDQQNANLTKGTSKDMHLICIT